ncbi:MAG: riboflavin synthase [bacterium]|nr:riboflavin synthase [bacterium]
MFTGLIETIGTVKNSVKRSGNLTLTIATPLAASLRIDQSVAIDGACQTVIACDEQSFQVIAVTETLERTTLGNLKSGVTVHLERAMAVGSRFDGHIVQGHIDGIATVTRIDLREGSQLIWLKPPVEFAKYIVEKGSVALSGVSFTVAKKHRTGEFAISVIPHTLTYTNLTAWRAGTKVNLETDVIAKYVESLFTKQT